VTRVLFAAALATVALSIPIGAFVACGQTAAPPKEPEPCKQQILTLTIIASPRINLANNGEARPVQLRIYQLATDVRLNNASFEEMWKKDKETLQEDFLKYEELSVYPDSRTDIRFERDERALVLGAVALFRQPKGRSWYTILELPPPPGKGACQPYCPGGVCGDGGEEAGPAINPHFIIWVDGSRVDEGSDHIDDYPESGRRQELRLPFRGAGEGPRDEQPSQPSQPPKSAPPPAEAPARKAPEKSSK
jgi:type VI secretion system protein VasD